MSVGRGKRWRVLQRDQFTCRYCGSQAPDVELQVDHIEPKAAGGRDTEDNLITACFDCNQGKKDRDSRPALDLSRHLSELETIADHFIAEYRLVADDVKRLQERLVEYEVLAEEHGWFE